MSEALFCEEHAVGVIPPGCPLCRVAELEAALREIRDEPVHHGYPDYAALVAQLQRWACAALAAPAGGEGEKCDGNGE